MAARVRERAGARAPPRNDERAGAEVPRDLPVGPRPMVPADDRRTRGTRSRPPQPSRSSPACRAAPHPGSASAGGTGGPAGRARCPFGGEGTLGAETVALRSNRILSSSREGEQGAGIPTPRRGRRRGPDPRRGPAHLQQEPVTVGDLDAVTAAHDPAGSTPVAIPPPNRRPSPPGPGHVDPAHVDPGCRRSRVGARRGGALGDRRCRATERTGLARHPRHRRRRRRGARRARARPRDPRRLREVGWFEPGVAPGAAGSAVLAGHVDSRSQGAGVFLELRRLDVGDAVTLAHAEGEETTWRVVARGGDPGRLGGARRRRCCSARCSRRACADSTERGRHARPRGRSVGRPLPRVPTRRRANADGAWRGPDGHPRLVTRG
jgi:hypothetical protein